MRPWIETKTPLAPEPDEEQTIDAELVEAEPRTPSIRRQPTSLTTTVASGPRVTMELSRWLDVDRKLWELYNLVDVAIVQRDEARQQASKADSNREVTASRLKEWKTYARSLEKRLHAAQIENLELSFALKRTAGVAEEALGLPAFSRRRRAELRRRLIEIGDDVPT